MAKKEVVAMAPMLTKAGGVDMFGDDEEDDEPKKKNKKEEKGEGGK